MRGLGSVVCSLADDPYLVAAVDLTGVDWDAHSEAALAALETHDMMRNAHLLSSSKEYIVSALNEEQDENDRLRAILLAFAGRPEVTQDTRDWLATQIREKGKAPVVHGLREEEKATVKVLARWSQKLQNHVDLLNSLKQGEHPSDFWYTQAVAHAEQVGQCLQELTQQLGRDVEDLERAR